MTCTKYIVAVFVLGFALTLCAPLMSGAGNAHAQTVVDKQVSSSDTAKVPNTCKDRLEVKGGVLFGRIIPCLTYTIERTTIEFTAKMINTFKPLLFSFLTLVVTLFGVKVLQGEREIGPQTFLLLIKIAFVVGMLELIPTVFIADTYKAMDEAVAISTSGLSTTSFAQGCASDVTKYGDSNTPQLWMRIDCVIGKMFGIAIGGNNPDGTKSVNMVLATSIVGLLSGFLFGGTLGVTVFFTLLGALWSVMVVVLRISLAYVNGFMIVSIMFLLSPLFIPLILLKITNDYFERWWRALMGGILLPIIISAYATFALTMYDGLLFAPNSTLQKLFKYDSVKDALQHANKKCDFNITNDPAFKSSSGLSQKEIDDLLTKSPFLKNFSNPNLSGGSDLCALVKLPVFDVNGFDKNTNKGKELFEKFFTEAFKLFALATIIAGGLRTVEDAFASMIGSRIGAAVMDVRSPTEQKIGQMFSDFKGQLQKDFSSESDERGKMGSDFMKQAAKTTAQIPSMLGALVSKR